MPGTRSAPTVNGTFNAKRVTLRWIDNSGEKRADTILVEALTTDAEIEAYAAAAQAISNASLYEVSVRNQYVSTPTKTLAADEVYEDVTSNLVIQFKDGVTDTSQRGYIPSADEAVMVAGTETPDPANPAITAYVAAVGAMLPPAYAAVGIRFTQRRDMNEQVPL